MIIQSEICHIDTDTRVVKVTATKNDILLGSALGEGSNIEIAEDHAISRLLARLKSSLKPPLSDLNPTNMKFNSSKANNDQLDKRPAHKNTVKETKFNSSNKPLTTDKTLKEPINWSEELSKIEIEIKRLSWDKEKEDAFLEKNYNYKSRSRITNYKDLIRYLDDLQSIKITKDIHPNEPQPSKEEIIDESDKLINQLQWNEEKGRAYLKEKMNTNSRHTLSISQLLEFNKLLRLQISE
ncbi:hypothetical protein [Prochlorococcus sp. MIT 1341]|uniref:hypothetical protein n=1 Tax=Prochlorococcus sp. MIT 1341 TaxID=3096221 RepID=UPI002A7587A8|nr:hypothetical protein [Prochlorococcus sp. MIT 1341]